MVADIQRGRHRANGRRVQRRRRACSFPCQIREIAQVADPTTQTFQVPHAMQAPTGLQSLPGMTATVTVTYRRASILGSRILVPISAVSKDVRGSKWRGSSDRINRRRAGR